MPALFTREIKDKNEKYIDLDGAGIIYPYVATKNWNSVYRIEAKTKSKVNFIILEDAVRIMKQKYPYFFSRISTHGNKFVFKQGYASNVIKRNAEICKPFDIKGEDTLIRVVYTADTIGVEFFHAITDGHGAQMFFNELLKEYFNIANSQYGYDSPKTTSLPENKFLQSTNDIYDDIYNSGGKDIGRFLSKAYQFDENNKTKLKCETIDLFLPALKSVAHKYDATVTQYLCAVQIAAIIQTENVKNKTVRISVPVDIRKYFEFESPRNASLYFLVEVKPKEITDFNSLMKTVKKQFENQLTKENMQNLAYANVKCAKMKAFKMLPLNLKKAALNIGYTTFGEDQFTSTLTNLGNIILDSRISDEIESVYYTLGKEKTKPFNIAVSTFKNETKLVISSTIDCSDFIKSISATLLADGVISSNTVKLNNLLQYLSVS